MYMHVMFYIRIYSYGIINEYLNHFSFEMLISGSKRNLYNKLVREIPRNIL